MTAVAGQVVELLRQSTDRYVVEEEEVPKDMFGDVVDPSIKMGNKMWYTVPLTMLLQATIVAALVIVPLMATGMMPTPPSMMAFVAAPPPQQG